jgi:nucleolar protein 56
VIEKGIANAIKSAFPGIECETVDTSEAVDHLFRGTREFADKMMKELREGESVDGCRAFSHAASRSKVKFNVTRHDQHVIQASATIDFQDKSVNQFHMVGCPLFRHGPGVLALSCRTTLSTSPGPYSWVKIG